MVKTVVQNETKSNPFITKGTSKTLLTPCRRVGLSRKRKTPNTSTNNSFSETTCSLSTEVDTTPVNALAADTSVQESNTKEKLKSTCKTVEKKKNRVSKRLICADKPSNLTSQNVKAKCITEDKTQSDSDCLKSINVDNWITELHMEDKDETKIKSAICEKISKRLISDDEEPLDLDQQKLTKKRCHNKTKELVVQTETSQERTIIKDSQSVVTEIQKGTQIDESEKKIRESPKRKQKTTDMNEDKTNLENKTSLAEANEDLNDFDFNPKKVIKTYQKKNLTKAETSKTTKSDCEQIHGPTVTGLTGASRASFEADFEQWERSAKLEEKIMATALKDVTNKEMETNQINLNSSTKQQLLTEEKSPGSKKTDKKSSHSRTRIKRSLSTKKSSTDEKLKPLPREPILRECSVSLSPVDVDQLSKEDLDVISELALNEIKDLEVQIKEKRQLVDELKQADVIKKKHDLKELQKLTALWKAGCISALEDLLPLLQKNMNLDMATLLNNFNIPKTMISLSESGDLS